MVNLETMKGEVKRKFLEDEREFILKYRDLFGDGDTLVQFNMQPDTLSHLLSREPRQVQDRVKDRIERAELKASMAIAACHDLRMELLELSKQFGEFQNAVADQLIEKIFRPMLSNIELPAGLEWKGSDKLSLEDIEFLQAHLPLKHSPKKTNLPKTSGSLGAEPLALSPKKSLFA